MRSWVQILIAMVVVFAVVGGVHYYLHARLVRATAIEPWQRIGVWVFTGSALLIPLGMIGSRFLPRSISSIVAYVTFTWMGLIVLAFFLTVATELVRGGAAMLELTKIVPNDPERRTFISRLLSGGVGLAALGLGGFGVAAARGQVQVKPVSIALKRFPELMNGFRLVQLSDVHIGPTIDGKWLADIVTRVNALEPDVVAITGDLVDGSVAELREHVAPLAELKAKHGVFFVTGNHEYYSGPDEWIAELTRMGIKVLRNERVSIGSDEASFDLAGIDDYRAKDYGRGHGADLAKAVAGRDESRELVLLAHQPKHAFEASKMGVGLQLSGHTHGGQIFPWGFFVKLDQTFVRGIDRLEDLTLYTSCGTGYWGPPMRVGAPPEITLIELSRG
ncbi:MAG: metallophosphoesterase [Polyangiaceae bacterium]|nr:metallophosphoesterase [Polyangiaceae bacterium]